MNRPEKFGLSLILICYFSMVGYKLDGEDTPWYVLVSLVIGFIVFLFGGEDGRE